MQNNIFILVGFIQIILIVFMQWQSYIFTTIKTFDLSSWILGIFLLAIGIINREPTLIILAILTILTRAIFIPRYLLKTIKRDIWRVRETRNPLGVSISIIISICLALFSYGLYSIALSGSGSVLESIPITLMLQGAFLIISKSNAYNQLIGYLVMENSIFLFGYIFSGLPFIVEAGIVLDILGIVLVSSIIMRLRKENIDNEEELYG